MHDGLEVIRHVLRCSGLSSFSKIAFLSWFDVFPVYFDMFVAVRSEKDKSYKIFSIQKLNIFLFTGSVRGGIPEHGGSRGSLCLHPCSQVLG